MAWTCFSARAVCGAEGFTGIEMFGDRRFAPPGPGEQRVYVMAVKEEKHHG